MGKIVSTNLYAELSEMSHSSQSSVYNIYDVYNINTSKMMRHPFPRDFKMIIVLRIIGVYDNTKQTDVVVKLYSALVRFIEFVCQYFLKVFFLTLFCD